MLKLSDLFDFGCPHKGKSPTQTKQGPGRVAVHAAGKPGAKLLRKWFERG